MTVTMSRLLPDPAILGRAVLAQSGAECSAVVPTALATKLPRFTFYRVGGSSVHPALFDRASCQCIAWGSSYEQARDLAETARVLFWQAWQSQFATADGHLSRVDETSAPTEIRTSGQPDGVWRFDSTYVLWVRPNL